GGPEYLLRLWAHRKVAYLLDELRLRGTNKELVDEVVRLATKHSIVTPYTSGLVVEDRELADAVETENVLPFSESEGLSDAPFEGPAGNGTIVLGGGAGGAFRGRGGSRDVGTGGGGRPQFEDAADDALRWLAVHQSSSGAWSAAAFDRWCDGKAREPSGEDVGRGSPELDVGVTGLALSAFLGAGYTNRGQHPFASVVSRGLRFLKNAQDPLGAFAPRASPHPLRQHVWAALAMIEAYGMTGSPIFQGSAQRSLDYLLHMRNAAGTWGEGDLPPLSVPPGNSQGARHGHVGG
ncbi:MAG: hypothetical protein O2894_09965, partial [Planctomycetota bacterium]|nr:hypothetical protein [Planctomycetota bacterium]